MKVGIIGSGGREHAIAYYLNKSKKIDKIFCFPGNAGTAEIAKNVELDLDNFDEFKKFITNNNIDLIIVGPEKPLVEGIVDFLENNKIKVFGPNKLSSKLEGSKIFTKKICEKYNIPTAKFGILSNLKDAENFLSKTKYPTVIKADNLASGKGVYICANKNEAMNASKEIFSGKFGKTNNVLIEEFLNGEEMSYFVIADGKTILNGR
jgi:phosphoribosylamine---glycine ligase